MDDLIHSNASASVGLMFVIFSIELHHAHSDVSLHCDQYFGHLNEYMTLVVIAQIPSERSRFDLCEYFFCSLPQKL